MAVPAYTLAFSRRDPSVVIVVKDGSAVHVDDADEVLRIPINQAAEALLRAFAPEKLP